MILGRIEWIYRKRKFRNDFTAYKVILDDTLGLCLVRAEEDVALDISELWAGMTVTIDGGMEKICLATSRTFSNVSASYAAARRRY